MKLDKSLVQKIRYQIKESKFPVAYWTVTLLLDYIEYVEQRCDDLEKRLILEVRNKVMEDHKELFKRLAERETKE